MFAKAFRVKSNTVIKGSERRKLRADISASFPSMSPGELTDLLPNKEELNVVKVYAHKGDAVTLYVLRKNPLFFELDKRLYPTVYMLWLCPNVLPSFSTWAPVIQKIAGGADLMLPGVVVPSCGLPEVRQGDCCAVKVVGNGTPMAMGTAALSTAEMCSAGMKGRGVCVLHTFTDHLWAYGDKSFPASIPDTETSGEEVDVSGEESGEEEESEEQATDAGELTKSPGGQGIDQDTQQACTEVEELRLTEECEGEKEEEINLDEQKSPQEEMDALLLQCFLHALKSKVKKSDLPLLTSSFLRNHMFPCW